MLLAFFNDRKILLFVYLYHFNLQFNNLTSLVQILVGYLNSFPYLVLTNAMSQCNICGNHVTSQTMFSNLFRFLQYPSTHSSQHSHFIITIFSNLFIFLQYPSIPSTHSSQHSHFIITIHWLHSISHIMACPITFLSNFLSNLRGEPVITLLLLMYFSMSSSPLTQ